MAGIAVIGIGVGDQALLNAEAEAAIAQADYLIGSARQLETVAAIKSGAKAIELPPLKALKAWLGQHQHSQIALLASGDPLFYGIGRWLANNADAFQLSYFPNISSIQAAVHAVGRSWQDTEVISLHGRPLQRIRARLANNRHYAVLTDSQSMPQHLALELQLAGFRDSQLTVCERLGYPDQQIRGFSVTELLNSTLEFDPLHVTLIDTAGPGGALAEFPGIADGAYSTDGEKGRGLLTKREVRIQVLSQLQTEASDICWDIGAGCGGVAIEWARWHRFSTVYAIEHHPDRLQHLHDNRLQFGVDANLKVVAGRAPDSLQELPEPKRVFIGGSDGALESILQTCWQRLQPGGVIVVSAVTESSKARLLLAAETLPGAVSSRWLEIAISRGDRLAGQLLMRPALPVTLLTLKKAPKEATGDSREAEQHP
ncbi:precorrin-6y C5,15-methyltransferase (decarboxylating) subunit CbiE [Marinobacterium jannaschii]|uniref:precorrin-6y C5,15-methyltransferase (decarboxylating) subunit CbiE n=1 Tax=Marinobacterium jannaschii TaxID=64970 RepID=UPI0009FEA16D|nr:precorrin-6y C5,15-methyltransferase (decarboxylating) subunit CbiE [Marinobacterium jannaschii]